MRSWAYRRKVGTGKSISVVHWILAQGALSMHQEFSIWEGQSRLMQRAELRISDNQE